MRSFRTAAMQAHGNRNASPVFLLAALSSLAGLVGCSSSQVDLSPAPPSSSPIKHVVVIMQENRSFDNFFHGFPGADSAQSGMNKGTVGAVIQPVPLAGTVRS